MPVAEPPASIRDMVHDDLTQASDIEQRSYDFPWSQGVFRDCLLAGYNCIVIERPDGVVGYAILSVAAGDAHILNLCVNPSFRHMRYGERLLDEILQRARGAQVKDIFLEVRPSNAAALALYKKKGFHQITQRPAYYQAKGGREDAAVLCRNLRK